MEEIIDTQAQEIYDRVIREIRKALEWRVKKPGEKQGETQEVIAEACGVTQPTINRILRGTRGINLPFLSILKLALALDIDLTALYLSSTQTQEKLKALLSQINKMIVNE